MLPLGGFATVWRRLLVERLRRTQAHQELAALDDRQLEDLGLTRDELVLAVAGAAEAPERVGMMAGRLGIEPAAFETRRSMLNEMVRRCAACRTKVILRLVARGRRRGGRVPGVLPECGPLHRAAARRPLGPGQGVPTISSIQVRPLTAAGNPAVAMASSAT